MNKKLSLALLAALLGTAPIPADACTGITLKSQDGQTIVARTIEWGGSDLNSQYVIVPSCRAATGNSPSCPAAQRTA